MSQPEEILRVEKLVTSFDSKDGWLRAVDEVSFTVYRGETLGIVGESGCGKSVTAMSIIDLLPKPHGQIMSGSIKYEGRELRELNGKQLSKIRGGEIGMIFQEPMTALNPVRTIASQMIEGILRHQKMSKKKALLKSIDLLKRVGIPNPEVRINSYPHQLSGGMRQRVMIAMAISCEPDLLIADEPTTALDVTVQAQILKLIDELKEEHNMATIMITHDLGVIAETCQKVLVMYAGRAVEYGTVEEIFKNPKHAYTQGLLKSRPSLDSKPKETLFSIAGQVAPLRDFVFGCRFCQRLGRSGKTVQIRPAWVEVQPGHWVENCELCTESVS